MNEIRNESEIQIGNYTYKLRPTFEAMARIETRISQVYGKRLGFLGILNSVYEIGIPIMEAKIMIEELSNAADDPIPEEDFINHYLEYKYYVDLLLSTVVIPKMAYGGVRYKELMDEWAAEEAGTDEEDEDSKKK